MRTDAKIALVVIGAGALLAVLTESTTPRPAEPTSRKPDDAIDDETALARMFASETESDPARIVVGWLAIQAAQRRKQTIFELLTLPLGVYGPRKINGAERYADTRHPPTQHTRQLANAVLRGVLTPSRAIRKHPRASWVEQLKPDEEHARQVLAAQGKFGGIWARIDGTRWFLYDSNAPRIGVGSTNAQQVLRAVPAVSPTDDERVS